MPSMSTSARNSPDAESLKFVCRSASSMVRSLFDAKMMMYWPISRSISGNCHLFRSVVSSVRNMPFRLMVASVVL